MLDKSVLQSMLYFIDSKIYMQFKCMFVLYFSKYIKLLNN